MLEVLFGNKTKEKVLLYLHSHGEGYAQEIRQKLELPLRSVQLQLKRMEEGGVLFCRERDRTVVYQLNPRYPFYHELIALIEKLMQALPAEVRTRFYMPRLRPRRRGKPI